MRARRVLKCLENGVRMLTSGNQSSALLPLLLAKASLLGIFIGGLRPSSIHKVVRYGMSAGVALVALYCLVLVALLDDTGGRRPVTGQAVDGQLAWVALDVLRRWMRMSSRKRLIRTMALRMGKVGTTMTRNSSLYI